VWLRERWRPSPYFGELFAGEVEGLPNNGTESPRKGFSGRRPATIGATNPSERYHLISVTSALPASTPFLLTDLYSVVEKALES
jgi:hypothetical protein